MKEIEAEAEKIIKGAEAKAQKIIEEAKRKADEILRDESYIYELEKFKRELEVRIEHESLKIIEEAKRRASEVIEGYRKELDRIVKKVVSIVTGVDIESRV
jgi:cell division septum initiation protein DivIVA